MTRCLYEDEVLVNAYSGSKEGIFMVSALNSSNSALNAMSVSMNVTANNVANVNTDGFKRQDVVLEEAAQGGVRADVRQEIGVEETQAVLGEILPDQNIAVEMEELSNVDLATEMVDMMATNRYFEANTKPIGVADEMKGTVINMVG